MNERKFAAIQHPLDTLCTELQSLGPTIPYYTCAYRDAITTSGRQSWLLGVWDNDALQFGCLAEYSKGRISRGLHIQATPTNSDDIFWNGLRSFCRSLGVTHLSLGTIGTSPDIPMLGSLLQSKERVEYWVDLTVQEPKSSLRAEQRRVYNRAVEAGMNIRQVSGHEAIVRHRELTSHSLGRRRARGELIPNFEENDVPFALLEAGSAQMYESVLNQAVVGSVIITLAQDGAHGYSAGFSQDGLKAGAGVFLNLSTFNLLKANGKKIFNLGDAPQGSGLALFKKGLGGVAHPSTAFQFHVGSQTHRYLLAFRSRLNKQFGL